MQSLSDTAAVKRFRDGEEGRAFAFFGCHKEDGKYVFRVYAPHAEQVFLVGSFNHWSEDIPMEPTADGSFRASVDTAVTGGAAMYKYKIVTSRGTLWKADPFAYASEASPGTASVVCDDTPYLWRDDGYLSFRKLSAARANIMAYGVYPGSFLRKENGTNRNWREIATELSTYVKQMGFTHICVDAMGHTGDDPSLPTECFFAPDARYGAPDDFKSFVSTMHEAGIGVLLSWNCDVLSTAEHGLCLYDGNPLYEKADCPAFDLSHGETRSFLVSAAVYWAECYHIDGLYFGDSPDADRLAELLDGALTKVFPELILLKKNPTADAISSLLDGKEETFDPLRTMLSGRDPAKNTVCAVDRAAVTGTGFPLGGRQEDTKERLARIRTLLVCFFTLPGAKLLFSGCELGRFSGFSPIRENDWSLLKDEKTAGLQFLAARLLHGSGICGQNGKNEFVLLDNDGGKILVYRRGEYLVVANFRTFSCSSEIVFPEDGAWRKIIHTEEAVFGGRGSIAPNRLYSENGRLRVTLPPLSACILKKEPIE